MAITKIDLIITSIKLSKPQWGGIKSIIESYSRTANFLVVSSAPWVNRQK